MKTSHSKLGDYFVSSREKGREGLPLMSVTLNNGLVVRDSLDRRTTTTLDPSEHLLVKEGDIAYNMMRVWQGALGRASSDGLVSPAYVVLRPRDGVDSKHAEYLFKTPRMVYLFWAYSYGLTKDRLRLYPNDFKKIPAKLPSLGEQKKISVILFTWDQAITATERLLENSHQRKKALMQQLLTGKKRLPGFEGGRYTLPLKDAASVTMGTSPKSVAYNATGNGLPLLQGNADIDGRRSKPRVFTSEVTKVCQPGDILLSVRAPVGSVAISNHEACIGRGICSIDAKNGNDQNFLYQWMLWYEPRWASLSQGSTFESVNSADINNLRIKLPETVEQKMIGEVLSVADRESELLMARLSHLKQEKKALMQQLLTGKRRVKSDTATPDEEALC